MWQKRIVKLLNVDVLLAFLTRSKRYKFFLLTLPEGNIYQWFFLYQISEEKWKNLDDEVKWCCKTQSDSSGQVRPIDAKITAITEFLSSIAMKAAQSLATDFPHIMCGLSIFLSPLFEPVLHRRCQRRAKLTAGRLNEATLPWAQYGVAVLGLGSSILAWKVTGLYRAICPLLPRVGCAIELQSKPSWPTAHAERGTRGINYSWPRQD